MIEEGKHWYIKNFNFFSELTEEQRLFVCHNSVMQTIKKGESFYFPKDESRTIYFLKEGVVKLFKVDESGNEIITQLVRKGEIFGESSIFFEAKRNESAIAEEECIVCLMMEQDMSKLMEQNFSLAMKFAKVINQRAKAIEQRLIDLSFKDNKKRILEFVKGFAKNNGTSAKEGILINGFPTHEDVAKLTSTSRQLVSTVLSTLKKQEIIEYKKRRMLIKDIDKI